MNKLLLFLSISFLCQLSWAQTTAREYEFLAKAQTVVIENSEFIRLNMEKKLVDVLTKRPELLTREEPTELIETLEDLASQGLAAKTKVKLSEAAKNLVMDAIIEVRTIIRKHGIAIGVSYAAISLATYAGAMVLAAMGQVQFAAVLSTVPTGTIFLVSAVAITRVIKQHKIVKLYGGKENYRYFKNLNKEVKKSLRLNGKKGLIVPLEKFSEDQYLAVTVRNKNLLDSIVDLIDHDRSKLTAKQLEYFLRKKNKWNEEMDKIRVADLSPELKLATLVYHVQKNDPELFVELQEKYPDSFLMIADHDFPESLKEWALSAYRAKSREELLNSVNLIPVNARVIDILKIWTRCLVPFLLEEGKNLTYAGYRGLSKSIDRWNILAELQSDKSVDQNWKNDFRNDLMEVLNFDSLSKETFDAGGVLLPLH